MIRRLFFALALLLLAPLSANAASRFWNPYSVTGAVSGTGGVCRLTISPAITGAGLIVGDTVNVTGIGGATGCNVSTTISAVVSSTQVELTGTTFGGTYTTGGCVGGGEWTATNTSNWAASSTATCGSGGSTVPGSSDTATLDGNSGGGTVTVNTNLNMQTLTTSAFTGTLDFSAHNNSVLLANFVDAGSGAHTINMGSNTWTVNLIAGNPWNITAGANLTLNANTSTVAMSPASTATNTPNFVGGGKTYNIVSFVGTNTAGQGFNVSGSNTFASWTFTAPVSVYIAAGSTQTFSATQTWNGTAASPIEIFGGGGTKPNLTFSAASNTGSWLALGHLNGQTNNLIVSSAFNLGDVTGTISTTAPTTGGGGYIIGQ